MKIVTLLICVLALLIAKAAALRYHKSVGIPTAKMIRQQESTSMRIAGGLQSYRGEHPFFAGLIITLKTSETSVCGGALISNICVVTIGQCWYDGESEGRDMEVVLGGTSLFSGGYRNYANWTILHPQYDPDYLVNDVALVRIPSVEKNISGYIRPIKLPPSYFSESLEGRLAQIIGLGKTSSSPGFNVSASLRDVYVKVMKNSECLPYYGTSVKNFGDSICTSGAKRKGACRGDYGGPLILRRYSSGQDLLIGLVSMTSSAGCTAGDPTGYTRIASYVRWINGYL